MYVRRRIRPIEILRFAWRNLLYVLLWSTAVTALEVWLRSRGNSLGLPFAPLGTIGVAVAFYLGFKNSQSYDRLWEGRKIWGGIVNTSRTFAREVLTYVVLPASPPEATREVQKRLIYRHLAWINALRLQLRRTTIFDRENISHVPEVELPAAFGNAEQVVDLLPPEEVTSTLASANPAAQIARLQALDVARLCAGNAISEFRQVALMGSLRELTDLQGSCERIKNTPFPRQYAYFSFLFVWVFVHMLPFGVLHELGRAQTWSLWLAIPLSVLMSWIYTTMEIVGDTSEDPFENYVNDVPMSAICRTIEIDLRQFLGEKAPAPLRPLNDVLL